MQGALTEERLPKEAAVRVSMALGTSVGGEADEASRLFSSIDRAQEGVAALAGSSAAAAVQLYESTARVQAMTGQVLSGFAAASHTWCRQVSLTLMSFAMLTSCSMTKPAFLWAGLGYWGSVLRIPAVSQRKPLHGLFSRLTTSLSCCL